jgi:hypothetical protein
VGEGAVGPVGEDLLDDGVFSELDIHIVMWLNRTVRGESWPEGRRRGHPGRPGGGVVD